jgi:hypothetical protein
MGHPVEVAILKCIYFDYLSGVPKDLPLNSLCERNRKIPVVVMPDMHWFKTRAG